MGMGTAMLKPQALAHMRRRVYHRKWKRVFKKVGALRTNDKIRIPQVDNVVVYNSGPTFDSKSALE
jgi:hypothetical protein